MSNCQINGSNYGVISIISHFMLAIHWGQLNVWVDIFSVFFCSFSNFLIFWPLNKHKTVLFDHLSYLWCGSCFGKCFFFSSLSLVEINKLCTYKHCIQLCDMEKKEEKKNRLWTISKRWILWFSYGFSHLNRDQEKNASTQRFRQSTV